MDGSYCTKGAQADFFCKWMVPCRLHDACPLHQTLVTGLWKIQKGLYKQRVEVWWGVRAKRNNCQHVSPTSNYATLRLCVCIQIHANELHAYVYLCMQLCIIHVYVCFWEQLRESVCVCVWGKVCIRVSLLCVYDSNKCGEREVAAESDGSFVCCRLSLRGGTLLHPTREGQLRVIGSLVLGGEFPPSHAFKWESGTEGKERGEESEDKQRVLKSDK